MKISTILKISALSLILAMNANAANIYLKNEDTAKVEVFIEPGQGTLLPNSTEVKQVLKPGEEKTVTITKETMNGSEVFSVKGKVTMPSLHNQCGPLYIDNDYKIVFVGGKVKDVVCTYQQTN